MIAGGTLNTRVFQNDLNQIQSGQIYTASLLRLPLLATFKQPAATPVPINGARPDLATDTHRNPIVGNVAGGKQITPVRIQIQEPANSLQLIWHALDPGGNYECSYPLNSLTHQDPTSSWPLGGPEASSASVVTRWAFGWLRINGQGPWFPMSLLPSVNSSESSGYLVAYPYGGFSSIAAPMSFIDWIGYWDGYGSIADGPMGGNAYILAITSVNLSLASNGGTIGGLENYATPSGSGTEAQPPNTDTLRNQDILVRGGNGRP